VLRSPLLSGREGKRAVERAWLLYTPVWGAITGVVMLGGFAESWGDVELMAFGALLALGTVITPLFRMPHEERALALGRRTATSMTVSIVVLAFGLNWLQTPFFFDVLHMHYGFHATWTYDRNPLFLYLVTIPYFATYSVLACMAYRFVVRLPLPRIAGWIGIALVPFSLAFLETLLNANPWMTRLFCYEDIPFALSFGTLTYGVSFVLTLPIWLRVGESTRPVSVLAIALVTALACVADAGALFIVRHTIAPLVTTVHDDAPPGGGCLASE
jgi:hypothetical protein